MWPQLTFPPEEAAVVRDAYVAASVILEYGSGGSTLFASSQKDKLVFSVESDRNWAIDLQRKIDDSKLASPAIVYHADIGPTGSWGRPIDDSSWRLFHRYPTAVWSEPFFQSPDLILIDGRFRPACLLTACLRATRPVRVLFDDYVDRPDYHVIERVLKPQRTIGRMAEFLVEPRSWPYWVHDFLFELCTMVTYSTPRTIEYDSP